MVSWAGEAPNSGVPNDCWGTAEPNSGTVPNVGCDTVEPNNGTGASGTCGAAEPNSKGVWGIVGSGEATGRAVPNVGGAKPVLCSLNGRLKGGGRCGE